MVSQLFLDVGRAVVVHQEYCDISMSEVMWWAPGPQLRRPVLEVYFHFAGILE